MNRTQAGRGGLKSQDVRGLLADTLAALWDGGLLHEQGAAAGVSMMDILEKALVRRGLEPLEARESAEQACRAYRMKVAARRQEASRRAEALRAGRALRAEQDGLVILANCRAILLKEVHYWESGDQDEDSIEFARLGDGSFVTRTMYHQPGPNALRDMARALVGELSAVLKRDCGVEAVEFALFRAHEEDLAARLGISVESLRAGNEAAEAAYLRATQRPD